MKIISLKIYPQKPYKGFRIYRKGGFYYSDDWSGTGFFPKKRLIAAIDRYIPQGAKFIEWWDGSMRIKLENGLIKKIHPKQPLNP